MSSVRRTAAALTALSALSALALTACGPADDAAGGSGTPSAGTPAAGASPSASAAPSGSATPAAKPSKSGGSPGSSTPTDPDGAVLPCGTGDVTFTASLAEPTTSSYLLKITNRGAKACRALGHPVVTFGALDGQATERGTAPGIADAIRLDPGESAYAGLMGGPADGTGRTVDSIAMTMNTESDLVQTPLRASTPGLYVSATRNSVTPWVDNAEDALSL
ncbi:DUF4232 domain-containing protein [Streptomyces sp. PCS3-D2]|uniref:DUF4232 domain-containing protein n=1 Tax=Streptomyces sp. PCS3-D2 TaxID=1460244 RepID=UPI0012FED3FC|nr:DUF4232 domain-containing protein [Streptomyces sp. PCS3-D2]WKV70740.1 DUF4232 domain-containing protein [Streptomyces sp. PCS3-D2]